MRNSELIWDFVALAISFWPVIYALIRRRWRRASIYLVLALLLYCVPIIVQEIWERANPDGDWEFGSPNSLYYGLSWPMMIVALWTMTAIVDGACAKFRGRGTGKPDG